MGSIIGENETRVLVLKNPSEYNQEIHVMDVGGQGSSELLLKPSSTKVIHQASLQDLVKDPVRSQSLLSLVYRDTSNTNENSKYHEVFEATLFLLENLNLTQNFNNSPKKEQEKCASIVILEEIPLVKGQSNDLQVHILPTNVKDPDTTVPLTLDTPCLPTPAGSDLIILRNSVIALSLTQCITIYEIETTLSSSAGTKIEIVSSDFVAKTFYWSQWVPEGNFLAFAHSRKSQQSSIEDESASSTPGGAGQGQRSKPMLSVFQFRTNYPQETVLNLPLDVDSEIGEPQNEVKGQLSFVRNVNVLCKNSPLDRIRTLSHPSGHVSIVQIPANEDNVLYKVNALHHNKTLKVKGQRSMLSEHLIVDTCLFHNGQFVAVAAYPKFLHLLDVGVDHEPSHHLLLDWSCIPKSLETKELRLFSLKFSDSAIQIAATKTSNTRLILLDKNLTKTELEVSSSLLIPMLLSRKPDINVTMAVIHYLLVHLCDVNAVKKPEALSRATTPMSPSSPMVCNSLGDIAALFGRRTSDLQLPFIEHESCTANKQEYVYSVNLRELSTHLLKERRDWPLHGHTVAGKYMNALVESARLLCHLTCLCLHLQPNRKCKGFKFIDTLTWEVRLKLFMLCEHISIALGTLACPLPQGFTPFFAYLGYTVLNYNQFLWHVRSGTFDLQIDLVKTIMADMSDSDEDNVAKKLHLISLLPKSRGTRVLNSWSHQTALCLRARQHASDLLSGVTLLSRKSIYTTQANRMKMKSGGANKDVDMSPLDTFLLLLTAKANVADIDLGLLAEATMLSMQIKD